MHELIHMATKTKRILCFLLTIILLIITYPFFNSGSVLLAKVFDIGANLVLIAGIYAISNLRRTMIIGSVIGALAIALSLMDVIFGGQEIFHLLRACVLLVFFVYTAAVIIHNVITSRHVNSEVIYGAIVGYLLLGINGATVFTIMEILDKASFNIDISELGFQVFMYYSFVTLSTLGYGDIIPTSPYSQLFAVLLSISGQLYLTILIAMLVGKYIRSKDFSK